MIRLPNRPFGNLSNLKILNKNLHAPPTAYFFQRFGDFQEQVITNQLRAEIFGHFKTHPWGQMGSFSEKLAECKNARLLKGSCQVGKNSPENLSQLGEKEIGSLNHNIRLGRGGNREDKRGAQAYRGDHQPLIALADYTFGR